MSRAGGRWPAARGEVAGWLLLAAVVFGLFNGCEPHRRYVATARTFARGDYPLSPGTLVRAIRAACTDDSDGNRYLAYASAALGRPYQARYVRTLAARLDDRGGPGVEADPDDPRVTPAVRPAAPLVPWRDFLVEYPPAFFLVAVPLALVAPDLEAHWYALALAMGLLLAAAVAVSRDLARRLGAANRGAFVTWAALATLALGTITVRRYDAAVSLALCLGCWGVVARRPVVAGAGGGLAVALKLLPALALPIAALVLVGERRWRELAIAAGVAAAVVAASVAPAVALAGTAVLDLVAYHGQRPLHVESTAGALLILARAAAPGSVSYVESFGSMNVVAAWDGPLRWAASVLPGMGVLAVYATVGARVRRHAAAGGAPATDGAGSGAGLVVRGVCAALAAWMALGKVFSPQYLTWLLPLGLVASLAGGARRGTAAGFVGSLLLTQLIFPFAYGARLAANLSPAFGALVLARNALLLAWAARLLAARERAAAVPVASGRVSLEASA